MSAPCIHKGPTLRSTNLSFPWQLSWAFTDASDKVKCVFCMESFMFLLFLNLCCVKPERLSGAVGGPCSLGVCISLYWQMKDFAIFGLNTEVWSSKQQGCHRTRFDVWKKINSVLWGVCLSLNRQFFSPVNREAGNRKTTASKKSSACMWWAEHIFKWPKIPFLRACCCCHINTLPFAKTPVSLAPLCLNRSLEPVSPQHSAISPFFK